MRWAATERSRGWCSTPPTRSALLGAALVAALAAVTILRPPPTSGPFARDFEAYYAAGATWNAGGDPWSRDVWRVERTIRGVDARRDEVLPFVGPPAVVPLWSLIARVPFAAARIVWIAVLAGALGALLAAALALAAPAPSREVRLTALVLLALGGPFLSDLFLGQIALLSAAALGAAVVALERRPAWGAAAAFVAALQPNLAAPLAVRLDGVRRALALAAAAAAFVALSLAVAHGPAGFAAYVQRLAEHGARERFIAIQHTVQAVAFGFGATPAVAQRAAAAAALAVVASVVAAARARIGARRLAWLAIALLPLAEPFFHEHDFVIEAIPVIGIAVSGGLRARTLAGIATVLVFVDWFGLAQRPPAEPQIAVLALGVACAYAALAWRTNDAPAARVAPIGAAVALALGCVPLAAAHAAPTWPDALGAYHAALQADISSVWGDEQRRSGLEQVEPVWAFLRALPLAGCALLALAVAGDRYPRTSITRSSRAPS